MSKRISNKVLLIGWGSADWHVINPLKDKGLLPNISALLEQGSKAFLGSIDPPIPNAVWTSALTSKAPIKHQILNLTEPNYNANTPAISNNRKAKFLWEIVSKMNLKTHQIGAPVSFPVQPINGVSVSDLFFETEDKNDALVFPNENYDSFTTIKNNAKEKANDIFKSWEIEIIDNNDKFNELINVIKNFLSHSIAVHEISLNLLDSEWDNFNIFFTKLSDVVHQFTPFHLVKNKEIPKQLHHALKSVLTKSYQFLDGLLGEILDKVSADTTIMIFSPNGYLPFQSYVKQVTHNESTYEYNTPGILIIKGKNAFKREELYAVNSLDICSTILALLGIAFAKDMDGKILLGQKFFDRINEPIETYEDENLEVVQKPAIEAIQLNGYKKRLEQLGYKTKDIAERQLYYKMRSKITSGQQSEAIPFLEEQWKKNPKDSWIGGRLAGCYIATNQIEKAKELIDKVINIGDEIAELHILKGNLLMMEMKFRSASKEFEIAERNIGHVSNLYPQIGEAYVKMKQLPIAKQYFEKEIKINPHPSAYMALANILLEQKMPNKAIEPLEKVTKIAPQLPGAWFHLGNCKMQTKDYEGAAEAFEQSKKINRDPRAQQQTQQALISLYRDHLNKPEKIKEMQDAYEKSIGSKGTITIVSGLPRSGTSMMMQMLVNGGLKAFTDGQREADDNNKKGYFEHEMIKSLAQNKQVLSQVGDKVVKIISHLLMHLPHIYKYKIVFMDRDIEEVMVSQHKMLGRLGKERGEDKANSMALLKTFEDSRKKAIEWCKNRPKFVEYLLVPYTESVSEPQATAKKVNEFLGGHLDELQMASVVDASLYREKK